MSSGCVPHDSCMTDASAQCSFGGIESAVRRRRLVGAAQRCPIDPRSMTRSIAPRTDEPIRISGCSRVAAHAPHRSVSGATFRVQSGASLGHDGLFVGFGLIVNRDSVYPIIDCSGNAGGTDSVEWIHGRDEPEFGMGGNRARVAAR